MKETILKICGFSVVSSRNGYEAYKLALKAHSYQRNNLTQILDKWDIIKFRNKAEMFDVVILDLNMPILDGYKACEKIRALYSGFNLMQSVNVSRDQALNTNEKLLKEIRPIIIACSSDNLESVLA